MARTRLRADNRKEAMAQMIRHLKQRNLKQRNLRRQLQSRSYTVDPERVAVAIIVKLAQGSPGEVPDGPSRGADAPYHLRQVA